MLIIEEIVCTGEGNDIGTLCYLLNFAVKTKLFFKK